MILSCSGIFMEEYRIQPGKIKLHLGCGNRLLPGYVNIDQKIPQKIIDNEKESAEGKAKPIEGLVFQQLDVRGIGKPYAAGTIQEIKSEHLFEHFTRVEAVAILAQWTILLTKNGHLSIEVPDFGAVCADFHNVNIDKKMAFARHLEGDQASEWAFHRVLWFKDRFDFILPLFGYDYIRFGQTKWPHSPNLQSLIVMAEKVNERSWDQLFTAGKEFLKMSAVAPIEWGGVHNRWCFELKRMIDNARKTGFCHSDKP